MKDELKRQFDRAEWSTVLLATFATPKGPWILGILLGAVGGCATVLFISALIGNIQVMQDFSLGSVGSVLALWLWLWHNGLHVNEFIERKYGKL